MTTSEELKEKVINRLSLDGRLTNAHVEVDVKGSVVKLTGTVPTYTGLKAAENNTFHVQGVSAVRNELQVGVPEDFTIPTDEEIKERIGNVFKWNANLRTFDIAVEVKTGWVTLSGSVDSYWKKVLAEEIAYMVAGVLKVRNELTIVPSHDVSDEQIAQQIKDAINLLSGRISIEDLNIIVEKGEVTITGKVPTHSEALAAYDAAFYTAGVKQVNDHITVLEHTL